MKAQIPGRDRGSLGTQNVLYLDPGGGVIDVNIDRKSSSEFIKLCTLRLLYPQEKITLKSEKRPSQEKSGKMLISGLATCGPFMILSTSVCLKFSKIKNKGTRGAGMPAHYKKEPSLHLANLKHTQN